MRRSLTRVERDGGVYGGATRFDDIPSAVRYLSEREGNVFVTTGSKEIASFAPLGAERLWARVLPSAASLEACFEVGISPSHVVAMQGPFSKEMNVACLKAAKADYMVTKESGRNGGYDEKIEACLECGVTPIVIGKPKEREGISFREAAERFCGSVKPEVFIVGIGPGGQDTVTEEAKKAINEADLLFGAPSVAAGFAGNKKVCFEFLPEKVLAALNEAKGVSRAAVLVRGDSGFFSGAKKLISALEGYGVKVIPGVSSAAYLAARVGVSWDDAAFVSLHGRDGDPVAAVRENKKTFVLTGGENGVSEICGRLADGLPYEVEVVAGEDLSTENEKITRGTARELREKKFGGLAIMLVLNGHAKRKLYAGIADGDFARSDGIPMTKSEVRAVVMSKLAPEEDSVIYDVGSGSGSVTVECALNAPKGKVYAIEKEESACALTAENIKRFGIGNAVVIKGEAPEAITGAEAPTHAFIGGCSGRVAETVETLLKKNPFVRIVLTAVTLGTLNEAFECKKRFGFDEFECVNVSVTRVRNLAGHDMFQALNPVYVVTMRKRSGDV